MLNFDNDLSSKEIILSKISNIYSPTQIFNLNRNWNRLSPNEFWKEIGSPRYICAPMVDQSELPFRMITRKYGADLTFTPMIHSVCFVSQDKYREKALSDLSGLDQPCFAQFCGHDPEILLAAGKIVENKIPCLDLNLGCPQGIARKGYYGSFLLENEELVLKILNYLSNNLKCGVSCKIRLFPDLNRSFEFVKKIEESGVKVLTVHGRTKEQNKHLVGVSNWDAIKTIKDLVSIPVIANGSIENYQDIETCFEITNCDAVMSSEKLLENPFLFSRRNHNIDDVAIEYISLCKLLDSDLNMCRSHLFKFYYQACKLNNEYNLQLADIQTYDEFLSIAHEIREFRKEFKNEEKFGWYYRYRKDDNPYKYSIKENEKPKVEEIINVVEECVDCDISNMFG